MSGAGRARTYTGPVVGWIRWVVVVVGVSLLLLACSAVGVARPAAPSRLGISPGEGTFTFDEYAPLAKRPVKVRYIAPADPATAQILIVMHGVGRDSDEYRQDWEPIVRGRNVLVLAPEFSDENYPNSESYNLGSVVDEDGRLRPRREWSFNVVEALFDAVVADLGSNARDYSLFGHSAGAQFVHRFVEMMPGNRARVAVAANAGWYTMPDDRVEFPYGLKGGPMRTVDLGPAFAQHLVLMLGTSDTDPEDGALRRDDDADKQGVTRLERGRAFFRTAHHVADSRAMPFAWRVVEVPNLAHSHTEAARAAAPLLLRDER